MFKFGQEVRVTGRLRMAEVTNFKEVNEAVLNGATVLTKKQEVVPLDKPRTGIVIGVRNYVAALEHRPYSVGGGKTIRDMVPKLRKRAYLVAVNMRDIYKVTEDCIELLETAKQPVD